MIGQFVSRDGEKPNTDGASPDFENEFPVINS